MDFWIKRFRLDPSYIPLGDNRSFDNPKPLKESPVPQTVEPVLEDTLGLKGTYKLTTVRYKVFPNMDWTLLDMSGHQTMTVSRVKGDSTYQIKTEGNLTLDDGFEEATWDCLRGEWSTFQISSSYEVLPETQTDVVNNCQPADTGGNNFEKHQFLLYPVDESLVRKSQVLIVNGTTAVTYEYDYVRVKP